MRPSLSILLSLVFFVWAFLPVRAGTEPGHIIFIGDSITQGGDFLAEPVASYRYQLFRNFVDNGIDFSPMGTSEGASAGVSVPTPDYRGKRFVNISESAASARSYQVCGYGPQDGTSSDRAPRYREYPHTVRPAVNKGPLFLKLGVKRPFAAKGMRQNTYANGRTLIEYRGDTFAAKYGDASAQTACIMIGINDKYDQRVNGHAFEDKSIVEHTRRIVRTLQKYNPSIRIHVMGLLPVGRDNGARHSGIEEYNALLKAAVAKWSSRTSRVSYADVSAGFCAENGEMVDTAAGAHPNAQGELVIAGNLARVMEVGQRTLGFERRASTDLAWQADLSSAAPTLVPTERSGATGSKRFEMRGRADVWSAGSKGLALAAASGGADCDYLLCEMDAVGEGIRTATYHLTLKMGSPGNGNAAANFLSCIMGDGTSGAGALCVGNEGIYWAEKRGQRLLYALPALPAQEELHLRVVVCGNDEDASANYHVWLGEQLIGENLRPGLVGSYKDHLLIGRVSAAHSTYATLSGFSMEPGASYAPSSTP